MHMYVLVLEDDVAGGWAPCSKKAKPYKLLITSSSSEHMQTPTIFVTLF